MIGNLMILSGNITARGSSTGCGSGIGTAYSESSGGSSKIENLTIMSGNITASSVSNNHGSGIGTGYGYYSGTAMIGNLLIVSGNITASSSYYGSGIGTGYGHSSGTAMIGNLTIVSGNITASSSNYGSGIGTGYVYYEMAKGTSRIGNLTIVCGNITANSSHYGSGIGTGCGQEEGISVIETLSILGGKIKAKGTESGIGSGFERSEVKLLRFSGTVNLFCTVTNKTKFPINASSIVLSSTSLMITTAQNRIFGVNPFREGSLNLSFVYENVTSAGSEPLSLLNLRFLQIGNVSLPISNFWRFCVSGIGHENCIDVESTAVKSLLFSVPSEGNYSIRAFPKV
jgi:hypothetical protein